MFRRARRRLFRFVAVSGAGAAAAYFFDPDRGDARRAQAREQADALLKRRQGETPPPPGNTASVYGVQSVPGPTTGGPTSDGGVEAVQV